MSSQVNCFFVLILFLISFAIPVSAKGHRPQEMSSSIILAQNILARASKSHKARRDSVFKEKIEKIISVMEDTDFEIDHENKHPNEPCDPKKERIAYSNTTSFFYLFTISRNLYFCDRILERSKFFQAQYIIHEMVHVAGIIDHDGSSQRTINAVPLYECETENLVYDIIEADGKVPSPTNYSLMANDFAALDQNRPSSQRVTSYDKRKYSEYCENVAPGLTERAYNGWVYHLFTAIKNKELPLNKVDKNIVYYLKRNPDVSNHLVKGGGPTALAAAVINNRVDWVTFLKEKTLVNARAMAPGWGQTPYEIALEENYDSILRILESNDGWNNEENKDLRLRPR